MQRTTKAGYSMDKQHKKDWIDFKKRLIKNGVSAKEREQMLTWGDLMWHDSVDRSKRFNWLIDKMVSFDEEQKRECESRIRSYDINPRKFTEEADVALLGVGLKHFFESEKSDYVFRDAPDVDLRDSDDYDAVYSLRSDGKDWFLPVQLKEIPNRSGDLQSMIGDQFQKIVEHNYADLKNMVFALRVKKGFPRNEIQMPLPEFKCLGLFIYGQWPEAPNKCFIFGDLMHSNPRLEDFDYPILEDDETRANELPD